MHRIIFEHRASDSIRVFIDESILTNSVGIALDYGKKYVLLDGVRRGDEEALNWPWDHYIRMDIYMPTLEEPKIQALAPSSF